MEPGEETVEKVKEADFAKKMPVIDTNEVMAKKGEKVSYFLGR